ncbi:MAG: hypothetical protein ACOYBS_12865, partial [Flavobacterium sp.]
RMTTAERTAIATPATGLQVYDTTTNSYWYYNGTAWTVNTDEWIHNGTDAIEATRPLANGNKFSITDSGSVYQQQGIDWSTLSTNGGTTFVFNSNPFGKIPSLKLISTDAINVTTPYTHPTASIYNFDSSTFLIKESHLSSTTPNKRYMGSSATVIVDAATTSSLSEVYGGSFYCSNDFSSSSISGGITGLRAIGDHFGTGTVAASYGGAFYSRLGSSGSTTNIRGVLVNAGTNSGATGNVSGELRGIEVGVFNNGTGTVNTLKNMNLSTSVGAAASIPTNIYGISNSIGNSSTVIGAATSNMYGFNQAMTNNSPTKYQNFKGLLVSSTTATTSGAPTNFISIDNYILNNSTSTDAISVISGYNSSVTHNGNSSTVSNLYGISSLTTLGAASTGTVTNLYGVKINQAKNVASTTTITNNYGLFLDPVIASSGLNYSIYSNGGKSYFKDNVGIGVSVPTATLDVNNTTSTQYAKVAILSHSIGDANFNLATKKGDVVNTVGEISSKISLDYSSTENASINFHRGGSTTGGFLSFATDNGTERVRILTNGNVAIGNTTAIEKLEVNGAIKIGDTNTVAPSAGTIRF